MLLIQFSLEYRGGILGKFMRLVLLVAIVDGVGTVPFRQLAPCQTEPAEKPTEPTLCTSDNQGCCDCGVGRVGDVKTYVFWPGDGSVQRCFHTYNIPSSAPSGGPVPVLLGIDGYSGGTRRQPNLGERGKAAKYYGFAAFLLVSNLKDGHLGFGFEFGNHGVVNDSNPTPCTSSDSRDIVYLQAVFKFIADHPTLLDADEVFTQGFSQNSMFAIYVAVCFAHVVKGAWQGAGGLAKTAHDPILPGRRGQCSFSSFATHDESCCDQDFCKECQYFPIYPRTCDHRLIDCIATYTNDDIACGQDWYMYEAMVAEGNDARLLSFPGGDGLGGHATPKNRFSWMAGCLGLARPCSKECATSFFTCIDNATDGIGHRKFRTCEGKIKAGELTACTSGCAPTLEMLQKSQEVVVTLSHGNFGRQTGLTKATGSAPKPNCKVPFGKFSDRTAGGPKPKCEAPSSYALRAENPKACPTMESANRTPGIAPRISCIFAAGMLMSTASAVLFGRLE